MKYSNKITESIVARTRVTSLSQPISAPHEDTAPSKDRASLMLLLDRGANVPKVDAAVGQSVLAGMFGTKEPVGEARVPNGVVSCSIPATMTLASLAQVEAAVPAPGYKLDSTDEAQR